MVWFGVIRAVDPRLSLRSHGPSYKCSRLYYIGIGSPTVIRTTRWRDILLALAQSASFYLTHIFREAECSHLIVIVAFENKIIFPYRVGVTYLLAHTIIRIHEKESEEK